MSHPDRVLDALTSLAEDGLLADVHGAKRREWTWLVPLPPRDLSPNAHTNRYVHADAVKQYRIEVCADVLKGEHPAVQLEHARLTLAARVCRRRAKRDGAGAWPTGYLRWFGRYHPTDTDNFIAACKALIDALGCASHEPGDAACVIANDRHGNLEHGAPSIVQVPDWRDEGVFIRLEELS